MLSASCSLIFAKFVNVLLMEFEHLPVVFCLGKGFGFLCSPKSDKVELRLEKTHREINQWFLSY